MGKLLNRIIYLFIFSLLTVVQIINNHTGILIPVGLFIAGRCTFI